ncbi:hypothetical protein PC116_g24214 [Phytophthora cactorum]|uniref:MULE transposase domain-containing protein n=2 Tax=Phytophthora cactorum TaxID=29920 RepID=A0A8T1JUQ4_9STRA|nr:hypothetical protein Pcac1_g14066 [Phytophthora cactorum]KAG2796575.1 hypothetical protein PC111_g21667 [Phytophthora cactorum]KAG2799540.1 hypothetical protein PC112_g20859 [Phytophthora cactorum]KAG2853909.1 hypothetical protein PC113_g13758 [Phytophthora cactorum]KAG2881753.1 hypothetical protein PC115_g22131 [Phytophthora cactorum]
MADDLPFTNSSFDHFSYDGSDSSDASDETIILKSTPAEMSGYSEGEVPTEQRRLSEEEVQDEEPSTASLGHKSMTYQGYSYAWYYDGASSTSYRCSVYRRTGCKAKLFVKATGTAVSGEPDCACDVRRPIGSSPTVVDWKEQMLLATYEIGLSDVTLTPKEVWRQIRDKFYNDDDLLVQGASKKQILGRLYRTRTAHFGREIFGRIESDPLCNVRNSPGLKFFHFHFTYYEDEVQHRVIGWAHPQLVDRMRQQQTSLFFDATYKCVLVQFYQLVIIMIYDTISDLYLPVFYVLTTGKTTDVYEHLLHFVFIVTKRKLKPAHVTCDFEYAMVTAIKNQFPETRIIGCLFHFKQAIRRKMLKLHISEVEVSLVMREGCFDRLTVIPRSDITGQGKRGVRARIKRDCLAAGISYSKENWMRFWKYFEKTWIKKFKPERWNVSGLRQDLVNRTNNLLERYNRSLNEAFSVAHPNVTQFIGVIEEQSRENVRLLADISNRRARAPNHSPAQVPSDLEPDSELDSDFEDSENSEVDNNFTTSSIASVSPEC